MGYGVGEAAEAAEAAEAVVCLVDHNAGNRCLNLSNTLQLEHLRSLPHKPYIALRLNNPNIRVWAAVVAAADFADRWTCALNREEVVVGFKPTSLYLYNELC